MSRDLCIMSCVFCKDPQFHAWLESLDTGGVIWIVEEPDAKKFILDVCGVNSRNDLDTNPAAGQRFHDLVRKPFLAWKEQP